MKLFQDDYIKNLPDCYNKNPSSNFYKLMRLFQYDSDKFRGVLQELDNSSSLDDSTGFTLDLYGGMYEQPRAGMTDEQYRIAIRQKMALSMCESDYNSIVNVIAFIVGAPVESFLLEEAETSGNVDVKKFPYDNLQSAGFTVPQAWKILETLLPAGVRTTGFHITHDVNEIPLNVASAVTFAENFEIHVDCEFYETIESETVTASAAVTHGENHTLEVLN